MIFVPDEDIDLLRGYMQWKVARLVQQRDEQCGEWIENSKKLIEYITEEIVKLTPDEPEARADVREKIVQELNQHQAEVLYLMRTHEDSFLSSARRQVQATVKPLCEKALVIPEAAVAGEPSPATEPMGAPTVTVQPHKIISKPHRAPTNVVDSAKVTHKSQLKH